MNKYLIVFFTGLFLLGALSNPLKSQGVDWKYVTDDNSGNPLYYDAESLQKGPLDVVNVWVKYKTPHMYKMKEYGFSVSLFKIDCLREKLANEAIVDFDRKGFLLSSVSSSGKPWFSISPDSLYGKLSVTVCPIRYRR